MRVASLSAAVIIAVPFILAGGCGERGASGTIADARARAEPCRTMPVRSMNETDYTCALGAELAAIAKTLATVEDTASAHRAVPALQKSKARLNAVKGERGRLNRDTELPGAAAALAMSKYPDLVAANKAFIREYTRLAKGHPDALFIINPALDGLDL